jgi:hypothetical protein
MFAGKTALIVSACEFTVREGIMTMHLWDVVETANHAIEESRRVLQALRCGRQYDERLCERTRRAVQESLLRVHSMPGARIAREVRSLPRE